MTVDVIILYKLRLSCSHKKENQVMDISLFICVNTTLHKQQISFEI